MNDYLNEFLDYFFAAILVGLLVLGAFVFFPLALLGFFGIKVIEYVQDRG